MDKCWSKLVSIKVVRLSVQVNKKILISQDRVHNRKGKNKRGGERNHSLRRINLYFSQTHYIVNFYINRQMTKQLALLLLFIVGVLSSCSHCKPAVKIENCYEPKCYFCEQNRVFNPDTLYCDCAPGTYPINGFCSTCPEGYYYHEIMLTCEPINPCGLNMYVDPNGVCKCLPGLTFIQGFCQRCADNYTYYPAYDACRCAQGYTAINDTCIFIVCGDNSVYSPTEQACVCANGYYLINGTCSQCPQNYVYVASNQSCIPAAPPLCGFNEYWYQCCCFCQLGYVRIKGVCVRCPQHSSYQAATDSCVCDPGYYFVNGETYQLPYQSQDTGSSYNNNPLYTYIYNSPSKGTNSNGPVTVQGSNYDASGINTNKAHR